MRKGKAAAAALSAAMAVAPLGAVNGDEYPFILSGDPIAAATVGCSSVSSTAITLRTGALSNRYLYITTPYLIIDYDLTEALRNAAKRGVDVRIITPHIADKKIIKIMTKGSYPYLLQSGVRIFEYTPGFIHEKLVVCDDIAATSGFRA